MSAASFFSVARRLRRSLHLQAALQSPQSPILHSTTTWRRYSGATKEAPPRAPRPQPRPRLQSALWPLGKPSANLVPQIERWVEQGNEARALDLQRVVKALRKLKRFKQALQDVNCLDRLEICVGSNLKVSEWMQTKSNSPFRPADHAIHLDLIGAVHGVLSAEDYFNKLPEEERTEKAYGALLNCYVRERLEDKTMALMAEMKRLGFAFSTLPYNNIMCLYAATGRYEEVHSVLAEMKGDGVFPDNFSYKMCINAYGVMSDIFNMEKLLKEMEEQPQISMDWNTYTMVANIYVKSGYSNKALVPLKKAEEKLRKGDFLAYNQMISIYGRLGDKSSVWRLWELQKKQCKKIINQDYTTMLSALVKINDLQEAEKLLKEWDSGENPFDFRVINVLLAGYQTNGLMEKGEALLDEYIKKGKKPPSHSWGILAAGYVEREEMEKAYEMMKKALHVYVPNAGWTPDHETVKNILCYLGEKGESEDVEIFVGLLKVAKPMNSDMYSAMIRARIREGKGVDDLLKGMQDDGIKEDKHIKEILGLDESKSN